MTLGPSSEAHLIGVHPAMVEVVRAAYDLSPTKFAIVQGLRSAAQQAVLYAKGRTAPGAIVTEKSGAPGHESNHQAHSDGFGWAVDLAALDPTTGAITWGVGLYTDLYRAMMAAAGQLTLPLKTGFELRSGSDWNMNGVRCEHGETDLGHFELHAITPIARAMAA